MKTSRTFFHILFKCLNFCSTLAVTLVAVTRATVFI